MNYIKLPYEFTIELLSLKLNMDNKDETIIKSNKQYIKYFKEQPKYSQYLLTIASNYQKKYSEDKSLNAAKYLNEFIISYWKNVPKNGNINKINNDNDYYTGELIINDDDRNYVSKEILDSIIYMVENDNFKILKLLIQCVKEIIEYYCKKNIIEYIKYYFNKIISCLTSKNIKKTYAGILLLNKSSNFFEYDNDNYQKIYNKELSTINKYLLIILSECEDMNDSIQAKFIYKIIKIYFKSFQGAIPILFTEEDVFPQWMDYIINIIKVPISLNNLNDEKHLFIKIKRICY